MVFPENICIKSFVKSHSEIEHDIENLKKLIKLSINMDMAIKNAKCTEPNTKVVSGFFNIKALKN